MDLTQAGTAIAIVSGLGGLWLSLWTNIRQRRAEREARAERDRHQASRVAGWILVRVIEDNVSAGPVSFRQVRSHAFVQNASDQPVWDVDIRVPEVELTDGAPIDLMERHHYEVIGPGEVLDIELPDTPPFERLPLDIRFTDNAGRRWCRNQKGSLNRLTEGAEDQAVPGTRPPALSGLSANDAKRNGGWLQVVVAAGSAIISIAALVISGSTMKDQAVANQSSKDATARALASRVTFWQITGQSAGKLFPSSENVVEIQNRSISGVDWIIVEREFTGQEIRWYVLPEPELPPCSSLLFPAPYEKDPKEYWEIEAMYFYNENGWWWRGDAGTLRPKVVRQDDPKLDYDTGLIDQMDAGAWPYSIRELQACS